MPKRREWIAFRESETRAGDLSDKFPNAVNFFFTNRQDSEPARTNRVGIVNAALDRDTAADPPLAIF